MQSKQQMIGASRLSQNAGKGRGRLAAATAMSENAGSDESRWLVSYADFMTLLMAFFVVMYSLSQVSDDYFRVLSETFDEAFNSPQVLDPLLNDGEPQRSFSPSPIDLAGNALQDNPGDADYSVPEKFLQADDVDHKRYEALPANESQEHSGREHWLQIELPSEVLFDSAGAKLSGTAESVIADVAEQLASHRKVVRVEGFTDNTPLASGAFQSNWELSAARATSVVKRLVDLGIDPGRLSAVGYGQFQPIATNTTEEGRAQNRRIVISVSPHNEFRSDVYREQISDKPKRLFSYEYRKPLPEGVSVRGLDKEPDAAASDWMNNLLGRSVSLPTVIDAESEELAANLPQDAE